MFPSNEERFGVQTQEDADIFKRQYPDWCKISHLTILTPILPEVKTMIELGNKRTDFLWKTHFENMGISHTSIDWNGKDGALPLNLNELIALDPADVVTNFGTSEHVLNQEMCFENIHNLSKKWIVHQVPLVGNWKTHGLAQDGRECVKYTEDFFKEQARKRRYKIEDMFISGKEGRKLINVRFRK